MLKLFVVLELRLISLNFIINKIKKMTLFNKKFN